jgi:pathogenesis-related protein 1
VTASGEQANYVVAFGYLSPSEQQAFLKVHNDARAAVGVEPLRWSNDLSSYALSWIKTNSDAYSNAVVKSNADPTVEHRPSTGEFKRIYGENLAFWAYSPLRTPLGIWPADAADRARYWNDLASETYATSAADQWLAEKGAFDKANAKNDHLAGNPTEATIGHYTQMVWRNTKEVGAAKWLIKSTGDGGWCRVIVFANYSPPGNMLGQKPF